MAERNIGKVVQVIGPVLDVAFDPEELPDIYNALSVESSGDNGNAVRLIAEVQQHIGRGMVKAVSMTSTDGVTRGMDVVDTGRLDLGAGRSALCSAGFINVLGEPVDEHGPDHRGGGRGGALAHPPGGPSAFHRTRAQDRSLRDGHQGRRPVGSVRKGR